MCFDIGIEVVVVVIVIDYVVWGEFVEFLCFYCGVCYCVGGWCVVGGEFVGLDLEVFVLFFDVECDVDVL